jgi:hypothetical protein
MSEPTPNPFDWMIEKFRQVVREVVREEIKAALNGNGNGHAGKEWLKACELAEIYGLPKTWFEERGRAGEIARSKSGRYVTFKRADVEAYLDQHRTQEPIAREKRKADNPLDG